MNNPIDKIIDLSSPSPEVMELYEREFKQTEEVRRLTQTTSEIFKIEHPKIYTAIFDEYEKNMSSALLAMQGVINLNNISNMCLILDLIEKPNSLAQIEENYKHLLGTIDWLEKDDRLKVLVEPKMTISEALKKIHGLS